MTFLLTLRAPDGTLEHINDLGIMVSEADARAKPIKVADEVEAKAVAADAAIRWSIRCDCFVRGMEVIPVD